MKIVTWNTGRAEGAWDYLLEELQPDFALLQEMSEREQGPGQMLWEPIGENSVKYGKAGTYKWGSGVWARDHQLVDVPLPTHRGWARAARPAGEKLTLFSLHAELDEAGRSIPILHRMLLTLTPALEAACVVTLVARPDLPRLRPYATPDAPCQWHCAPFGKPQIHERRGFRVGASVSESFQPCSRGPASYDSAPLGFVAPAVWCRGHSAA